MQIHELTRPRKTNEGLLSSLAGGVISQLGKQTMNKAFGGTDVTGKFKGPATDRAGAYQQGVEMARTLVPLLQKSWAATVQEFLRLSKDSNGNPATSLAMVTSPSLDTLKAQLDQLISKSIRPQSGFVYTQLPRYVGDDPVNQKSATQVVQDIAEISTAIYDATVQGKDSSQNWQSLVTNGIAPAQNVLAYDTKHAGSTGAAGEADLRWKGPGEHDFVINFGRGWIKFDPRNPDHEKVRARLAGGT